MADAALSSPNLLSFQSELRTLTDLSVQLRTVRRIPTQLVKPPQVGILEQLNHDSALSSKFNVVKGFAEAICSDASQQSLQAARASQQKDKSDLLLTKPRENRKRKRQPSPGSPRVYIDEKPQRRSLFPPDDAPRVRFDELVEYLRDYNELHPNVKVQIVSSNPQRKLACPVLLRYSFRDTMTIFLTLDDAEDSSLIVENATAFASREQKPHHSQSDFIVFQKLSQQIATMIHSEPQISFRPVLALLKSYEDLFSQKCTHQSCGRMLSPEAHIPPLARVWSDDVRIWEKDMLKTTGSPGWEPFHPTCLRR